MPEDTQKQIAAKYRENLTYYKNKHPFRRLRFWLALVALLGGILWALGFEKLGGSPEFFNTGPISQNHEQFKSDCAACHLGASTEMLSILPFGKVKAALHGEKVPLLRSLQSAGSRALSDAKENIANPKKLAAAAHEALSNMNIDAIDQSCLRCHDGMAIHQPGTKAVMFRESQKELSIVAADGCSVCHKEHVGSGRMALPDMQTCVACHADAQKLSASLRRVKFDGSLASTHSQNVHIGDFVQWIPAAREGAKPKPMRAFASGHPAFLYEGKGRVDSAQIQFNHARHFAADIPEVDGRKLDCRSCHEPDGDGVGMQRITYDKHCQKCHSLGADPDLPGFTIPHHDPVKVRDFLASLYTKWSDYAGKNFNISDADTLKAFLDKRGETFKQRWGSSLEEVQRKVFFVGDPPVEKARQGQFLPACNKCHVVTDEKPVPKIARTNIPDGWLTRGPYKHAAHLHMECTDCHNGAKTSEKTSDILLPSQKLCTECHRPRDYAAVREVTPVERIAPTFGQFSAKAAQKQREEGGVFDSCLGCHKYHVPAAEMEMAKSLAK